MHLIWIRLVSVLVPETIVLRLLLRLLPIIVSLGLALGLGIVVARDNLPSPILFLRFRLVDKVIEWRRFLRLGLNHGLGLIRHWLWSGTTPV